MPSQTFTTAGAYTFNVPSSVTSVIVECIGGGQGGDGGGGSGGIGGDYAKKNALTVTPLGTVTGNVGAGSLGGLSMAAPAGGDSYAVNTATVCGKGGSSGTTTVGDVTHTGGAAGSRGGTGGGGGGSSAGPSANGGTGTSSSGATGGAGGVAPAGGGTGGSGGNAAANGNNGVAPGGAGGGAGTGASTGGNGADGQVKFTWSISPAVPPVMVTRAAPLPPMAYYRFSSAEHPVPFHSITTIPVLTPRVGRPAQYPAGPFLGHGAVIRPAAIGKGHGSPVQDIVVSRPQLPATIARSVFIRPAVGQAHSPQIAPVQVVRAKQLPQSGTSLVIRPRPSFPRRPGVPVQVIRPGMLPAGRIITTLTRSPGFRQRPLMLPVWVGRVVPMPVVGHSLIVRPAGFRQKPSMPVRIARPDLPLAPERGRATVIARVPPNPRIPLRVGISSPRLILPMGRALILPFVGRRHTLPPILIARPGILPILGHSAALQNPRRNQASNRPIGISSPRLLPIPGHTMAIPRVGQRYAVAKRVGVSRPHLSFLPVGRAILLPIRPRFSHLSLTVGIGRAVLLPVPGRASQAKNPTAYRPRPAMPVASIPKLPPVVGKGIPIRTFRRGIFSALPLTPVIGKPTRFTLPDGFWVPVRLPGMKARPGKPVMVATPRLSPTPGKAIAIKRQPGVRPPQRPIQVGRAGISSLWSRTIVLPGMPVATPFIPPINIVPFSGNQFAQILPVIWIGEDYQASISGTFSVNPTTWLTKWEGLLNPGDIPLKITLGTPAVGTSGGGYGAVWNLFIPAATTALMQPGLWSWLGWNLTPAATIPISGGTVLVELGPTQYP